MLDGKPIDTAYNRASVSACSCTRALHCTAQRLLPLAHPRRRWRESLGTRIITQRSAGSRIIAQISFFRDINWVRPILGPFPDTSRLPATAG